MEPAKYGETIMIAAWAAVRALPRSFEAAKLSIITVSTGLQEGEKAPRAPIENGGPGGAPFRAAISAGSGSTWWRASPTPGMKA